MDRGGGATGSTIAYEPGIDGLRAVAVALVLLYHAPFGWASGGFLGVSLFFTLSGFLITRLLLAERSSTGCIDLVAFWTRRFRRLAPAATACIAGAVVVSPFVLDGAARATLRWDAWSALTYWANWRAALGGRGYSELFASPGLLEHMWSLSIEEQFYLVYPALVAAVLYRRGRAGLATILSVLLAASIGAALVTGSPDLVYAGTHTRAAELLVGALAALVVGHRPAWAATRTAGALGAAGLAVVLALSVGTDLTDRWLYRGGFAAVAVASAGAVVGATAPGVLRRVLSAGPMPAIGRRSYGLYLAHWPVFVVLDPARTGLGGSTLMLLRLAVSAAIAEVSYRWLERPIRTRRLLPRDRRLVAGAAAATVTVAALAGVASRGTATEPLVAAGITDFGEGRDATATDLAPMRAVSIARPDRTRDLVQDTPASTMVTPAPTVAVVGGDAATRAADALRAGFQVERVVCALPACAPPDGPVDVAVVVLGPLDRGIVDTASADERTDAFVTLAEALAVVVDGYTARGVPVVLADVGPDDFLRSRLGVLDLASDLVVEVDEHDVGTALLRRTVDDRRQPVDDVRLAVMVIGDSTSYGIAAGMHDAAGDRLRVLWAGGANCPLVPAVRIRWWEGNEFDTDACPTVADWSAAASTFEPDAILVASSFAEQTEMRLPGSSAWSAVGDEVMAEAHDAWLDDVRTIAARTDAPVIIADSPPFAEGSFAGSPMAGTQRIAAWNAQIDLWDRSFDDVVRLPWTAVLAELEAGGSLRSDGVHLDHDVREDAGDEVAIAIETIVTGLGPGAAG